MRQSLSEYKQSLYNFASPTATFIAVCFILFVLFSKEYIQVERIAFLDIAIIALASMRLIRLLCHDSIFAFIRGKIAFKTTFVTGDNGEVYVERTPRGVGYGRMLATLLECPWCIGVWTTLVTMVLYVLSTATALLVVVIAIAGIASALQLLVGILGCKYEELDMKNELARKE